MDNGTSRLSGRTPLACRDSRSEFRRAFTGAILRRAN
jgi:hypothetical protein